MFKEFLSATILFFFPLLSQSIHANENKVSFEKKVREEKFLNSLGSLSFLLKQELNALKGIPKEIPFSEEEISMLWDQINDKNLFPVDFKDKKKMLEKSYADYLKGKLLIADNKTLAEAEKSFSQALNTLLECRGAIIDSFNKNEESLTKQVKIEKVNNSIFEGNRIIPRKIKSEMRPYVISDSHPMKSTLDSIFLTNRATLTKRTFLEAGFKPIGKMRPRSFVVVAKHPIIPGYLVKAYLDSEHREKRHKPSWHWLVQRCEGAEKVRRIIQNKNIRHFKVANKWIYPFPENPFPLNNSNYKRHLALLLTTDMNLASTEANLEAWKNAITENHLDELFYIITYAKGSSYRPDNICYTQDGFFAFIDTEYPDQGPDYISIRSHLSGSMRKYWDSIVTSGGPQE